MDEREENKGRRKETDMSPTQNNDTEGGAMRQKRRQIRSTVLHRSEGYNTSGVCQKERDQGVGGKIQHRDATVQFRTDAVRYDAREPTRVKKEEKQRNQTLRRGTHLRLQAESTKVTEEQGSTLRSSDRSEGWSHRDLGEGLSFAIRETTLKGEK
jgi:hypothetical protein